MGHPVLPAAPLGLLKRGRWLQAPITRSKDLDLLSHMSMGEEGQGHGSPYLRGGNALAWRVEEELPQQVQGLGRGVRQHLP